MEDNERLPTREEFVAFWESIHSWRSILPHVLYLSGLALYVAIVRAILKFKFISGRFWLVYLGLLGLAVAYIILFPYMWIRIVQKRFGRFIKCPKCGSLLGRGASGEWYSPNPK
jgi:hypothetical protein